MIGPGGMLGMVERLVTMLLEHMADNIADKAYYARETGGCPSQAAALTATADALRQVDVEFMMKELMRPQEEPDEDQPLSN